MEHHEALATRPDELSLPDHVHADGAGVLLTAQVTLESLAQRQVGVGDRRHRRHGRQGRDGGESRHCGGHREVVVVFRRRNGRWDRGLAMILATMVRTSLLRLLALLALG